MSVHVTSPIWKLTKEHGISSTQKLILVKLGDNAWDDGSNAYPKVGTIAIETCLEKRTVQKNLRELEKIGFLLIQKEATHDFPTIYKVNLKKIKALIVGDESNSPHTGRDESDDTRDEGNSPQEMNLDAQRDESDSPKPSINHKDKPLENHKDSRSKNERNELLDVVLEVCHLSWDTFRQSGKTKGLVNQAAKILMARELTPDDIRQCYGKGGWWWTDYWIGKDRNSPPRPEQIADTIDQAIANSSETHRKDFVEGWENKDDSEKERQEFADGWGQAQVD